MKIWHDGCVRDQSVTRIDPTDRGFTMGDGVFETIRLHGGWPVRLDRHLRRLADGAALLRIALPASEDDIATAIGATAAANAITDGAARITLSRGPAPRGVLPSQVGVPTLLVSVGPAPRLPDALRVVTSRVTRRNEFSPLSRIKSLNYLDSVLARQEAADAGADDALMLNGAGRYAEATAANLFLVRDGCLVTPPIAEGALPGIARAVLMERCGAREAPLARADIDACDGLVLANSLWLRVVSHLDGRTLPMPTHLITVLEQALAP